MRVPHQLLILCSIGLAGWLVIQTLPERSPAFDPSNLDQLSLVDDTAAQATESSDRFVQEPSKPGGRHTARRPSFESASKYSQRFSMLQAFREAVGPAFKSTVEVMVDDERLAFGAIIDADGWIITKDSQLPPKGKLVVRIWTGEESVANVVSRNSSIDIALLRIDRRGLQPIQWSDDVLPSRGSWLATTSTQDTPAAFGIVSAGLMSVLQRKVRMGVVLKEDSGAVIEKVYFGTGADQAGLRTGDFIRAVDGKAMSTMQDALTALQACRAGQYVQLTIQRGKNEMETQVRMMDLADDLTDETEMEVNGSISARSSGFTTIFMHDTVLMPNQCGGPLVNLDGRAVGINIARAGRVSSYALPTAVVRSQVNQMLTSAKGTPILTTK